MSAPRPPRKPVTPGICVLINQAAFPGLGTRLAGRPWGWAQMTLMLAGFVLVLLFMIAFFTSAVRYLSAYHATEESWRSEYHRLGWIGWAGLGLVIVSWLWAGVSSLAIWRDRHSSPPPLHGRTLH